MALKARRLLSNFQLIPEPLRTSKAVTVDILKQRLDGMSEYIVELKDTPFTRLNKQEMLTRYNEAATELQQASVLALQLIVGKELFPHGKLVSALLPGNDKGALIGSEQQDTWRQCVTEESMKNMPQGTLHVFEPSSEGHVCESTWGMQGGSCEPI